MENLKESFYKVVEDILDQEMRITNLGVFDKFKPFVFHLEKAMTHPRIKNQFELAFDKYQKEHGVETLYHKQKIFNWINDQPKNY